MAVWNRQLVFVSLAIGQVAYLTVSDDEMMIIIDITICYPTMVCNSTLTMKPVPCLALPFLSYNFKRWLHDMKSCYNVNWTGRGRRYLSTLTLTLTLTLTMIYLCSSWWSLPSCRWFDLQLGFVVIWYRYSTLRYMYEKTSHHLRNIISKASTREVSLVKFS